ncbi:MAG: hypothetical protein LUQ65_07535 [Candidatus Helarchaeota archaeon]|nr:hypothetical protein [Candidatus Helarchaeota archaeon]
MRKDTIKNVIKIVKCLEAEEGWTWIREIARKTGIHHKTVCRLIDLHLNMFLETQAMEPFKLRMVRLKPDADINGIMRYLAVKNKIDNVRKSSP